MKSKQLKREISFRIWNGNLLEDFLSWNQMKIDLHETFSIIIKFPWYMKQLRRSFIDGCHVNFRLVM